MKFLIVLQTIIYLCLEKIVPRRPQKKDALPPNLGIDFFPVKKEPTLRHIKAPDGTPPRSPCASRGNSLGVFRPKSPKMQIARFYFPHGPPALPKGKINTHVCALRF